MYYGTFPMVTLTDSVYIALASSIVVCLQLTSSEPGSEANQDLYFPWGFTRLGSPAVWTLVINDIGAFSIVQATGRKEGRKNT